VGSAIPYSMARKFTYDSLSILYPTVE